MIRVNGPRLLRCAVLGVALSSIGCVVGCEVGVADYPDGYYDDYPPDAYIATTAPVYYDGYPAYWYHDRWFYRVGGRWNHFDREPSALHQYRAHAPPARRNYEPAFRSSGRAGARPSGGHFGGAHGGHR